MIILLQEISDSVALSNAIFKFYTAVHGTATRTRTDTDMNNRQYRVLDHEEVP